MSARLRAILCATLLLSLPLMAGEVEHLKPVDTKALQQTIADTPGKLKVVNFWATWCLPCVREFPDLVKTRQEFKDQGVEVIFVSLDFPNTHDKAKRFLAKQGVDWPSYLADGKAERMIDAMDPDWDGNLPGTFICNPQGKRLAAWHGVVSYEELSDSLREHLAAQTLANDKTQ